MVTSRIRFAFCILIIPLCLARTQQKSGGVQKPSEKDNRQFSVLKGEKDGHSLFAMIAEDLQKFPAKSKFPWFLSLSTPLIDPTPDGLPQGKDFDSLNNWEDTIEVRIAKLGKYYYVGHVTCNGSRELLFYLEKPEPVVSQLKKLRDAHSTRPFDLRYEKDEGWKKMAPYLHPIEHPSPK